MALAPPEEQHHCLATHELERAYGDQLASLSALETVLGKPSPLSMCYSAKKKPAYSPTEDKDLRRTCEGVSQSLGVMLFDSHLKSVCKIGRALALGNTVVQGAHGNAGIGICQLAVAVAGFECCLLQAGSLHRDIEALLAKAKSSQCRTVAIASLMQFTDQQMGKLNNLAVHCCRAPVGKSGGIPNISFCFSID